MLLVEEIESAGFAKTRRGWGRRSCLRGNGSVPVWFFTVSASYSYKWQVTLRTKRVQIPSMVPENTKVRPFGMRRRGQETTSIPAFLRTRPREVACSPRRRRSNNTWIDIVLFFSARFGAWQMSTTLVYALKSRAAWSSRLRLLMILSSYDPLAFQRRKTYTVPGIGRADALALLLSAHPSFESIIFKALKAYDTYLSRGTLFARKANPPAVVVLNVQP